MLKLQTDRPLAFFDIEATGTNPRADRIVDLAILIVSPDGARKEHSFRFHPGRPIPPEAIAVHGITDADVANCPPIGQHAAHIARLLEGCDLAGYNILRYDIPLLVEELTRAGVAFSAEGRRVVDVQRIYHKREPRDLAAALAFYCQELHLGAHDAMGDVQATLRVFEGQLARYKDLPRAIQDLAEYCNPRDPTWVDSTGKFKWSGGEVLVNFGKNQNRKLADMARQEPSFLKWMLSKDFPRDAAQIARDALDGKFPQPPAAPAEE
jgi:DNA polymerase III subunit epsilon